MQNGVEPRAGGGGGDALLHVLRGLGARLHLGGHLHVLARKPPRLHHRHHARLPRRVRVQRAALDGGQRRVRSRERGGAPARAGVLPIWRLCILRGAWRTVGRKFGRCRCVVAGWEPCLLCWRWHLLQRRSGRGGMSRRCHAAGQHTLCNFFACALPLARLRKA